MGNYLRDDWPKKNAAPLHERCEVVVDSTPGVAALEAILGWETPSEWMGDDGDRTLRSWGMRPRWPGLFISARDNHSSIV